MDPPHEVLESTREVSDPKLQVSDSTPPPNFSPIAFCGFRDYGSYVVFFKIPHAFVVIDLVAFANCRNTNMGVRASKRFVG